MGNFFKKIKTDQGNRTLLLVLFFVLTGVFIYANPAFAGVTEKILNVFTIILHAIVYALGWLVGALIFILVLVAKVNEFIDVPAVEEGWVIVRDLCNMFFILILLIIAFATILRVESYNAKKLLPRLLIMAVLINFSKTICGLIIDFSQVIMLTFVYSFEDVGGANFAGMLGLSWILDFNEHDKVTTQAFSIVGAYILAIVYTVIALVTVTAILGVLVVRIVMLWIYVVLSPLAYLTAIIPQTASFASRWWGDFLKYVTVGPILAFFVWLSFISMDKVATGDEKIYSMLDIRDSQGGDDLILEDSANQEAPESLTKAGTPDHLIQFAISIGMLLGGLMIAQEASSSMSGGIKTLKQVASQTKKGAKVAWNNRASRAARTTAGTAAGTVDRMMGRGVSNLSAKMSKKGEGMKTLETQGLVGAAAKGTWNLPKNTVSAVKKSFAGNQELNEQRRDALHKGYHKDKASGKRYDYDKASGSYVHTNMETGEKETWKNSEGKDVKRMGMAHASFYDAYRSAGSGAAAARNQQESEKVEKEAKQIESSGINKGEMQREFESRGISQTRKKALAMTMASKGAFESRDQAKKAQEAVSDNSVVKGKFNENLLKKQAHLAFDLDADDEEIRAKAKVEFQQAIDNGKIDLKGLSPEALKNEHVMDAVEDYAGPDFGKLMEHYNKSKKHANARNEGLIGLRDMRVKQAAGLREAGKEKEAEEKETGASKARKTHAKVSGNIKQSFTVDGEFSSDDFGDYLATSKAKDVEKIKTDDLDELLEGSNGAEIEKQIAQRMDFSKLKQMARSGDNPVLLKKITDIILKNNGSAANNIRNDNELLAVAKIKDLPEEEEDEEEDEDEEEGEDKKIKEASKYGSVWDQV